MMERRRNEQQSEEKEPLTEERSSNNIKNNRSPQTNEEDDIGGVTKRAARGALESAIFRIVSFVCAQWTIRLVDPSTLGQTHVQLELIHASILFVSREGFRLALTRNIAHRSHNSNANWNVAWLTIPTTTLVSCVALAWHLYVSNPGNNNHSDDYRIGGILYCLAALLEGWAEPAVLYALRQMNVAVKASAEALATVGKTFTTVFLLHYYQNYSDISTSAVTAFGLAQIMYAFVYASVVFSHTARLLPLPPFRRLWSLSTWDLHATYMTLIFTAQGLLKHLLTEGDRIVLSTLVGSYDQGVYAMGSAYGGLAARFLLQPLEENGRLLWSRLASASSMTHQHLQQQLQMLESSYTVLVKLVLYVGLVFCSLAVHYTHILLTVLAGQRWGSIPQAANVLSAFCVYTAFLAWNGMTEAFVYAAASSAADMGRLGIAHTGTGLVFAILAPLAVAQWGTVGLVAANCCAMLCRTVYSVRFAALYFCQKQLENKDKTNTATSTQGDSFWSVLARLLDRMIPKRVVLIAFLASFVATRLSLDYMQDQVIVRNIAEGSRLWLVLAAQHVALGATCGMGVLTLAYFTEGEFRESAQSLWQQRQEERQQSSESKNYEDKKAN